MSEPTPLRELRELLSALLARPLGGALVVGCPDPDMLLLLHALDSLDTASPADRFFIHGAPFTARNPTSTTSSLSSLASPSAPLHRQPSRSPAYAW